MRPERFKMPFGKYKGIFLESVPISYLRWLQTQEWVTGRLLLCLHSYILKYDTERKRRCNAQTGPPPFDEGTFWEGVTDGPMQEL